MQSALAFEIVKYVGAIYLIYLGVSSFLTHKSKKNTGVEQKKQSYSKVSAFKQGALSNILNPKVAMFFITFLPQFVQPGTSTTWQLITMGIVYTLLSISWFFVYVFFIHFMREWLLSAKVQKAMDRITGVVLIGFGLKLALAKRNL